MKKTIILLLFLTILSGCKISNNFSYKEIVEYAELLNLPKEKVFYIQVDSLKKQFKGEKLTLQNHGIKVMDSKLNVLKTKEGKCSIKKLTSVTILDSLEIDQTENNKFVKIYPNLSKKLKEKNHTILCIWSKYYPKKVTLENIELALENKNKHKDCQILYLNADIYYEMRSVLR